MRDIDVVIVSYNSEQALVRCVSRLAKADGVHITVVDNASQDGTLEVLSGLPVTTIALDWNSGFAHGCNTGWRRGASSYVLFLNPDAAIDTGSLAKLAEVLDMDPSVGIVAPRIVYDSGALSPSLRRYPILRRSFAQALFLHRLAPSATWANEIVSDPAVYEHAASPDWVSGACILIRRSLLEKLDGFDERFFLYSEDVDLCLRVRQLGADIRYEPRASCIHTGGASAPQAAMLPVLAAARIRFARKHRGIAGALLERAAVGLSAATHIFLGAGGLRARTGHVRALGAALSPARQPSRAAR